MALRPSYCPAPLKKLRLRENTPADMRGAVCTFVIRFRLPPEMVAMLM
jgi:hypothetical protein